VATRRRHANSANGPIRNYDFNEDAGGKAHFERRRFCSGAHRPMTSHRQIEANRRNALRSTGPITPAGKQRSRRNALRHGLSAETVITAVEDIDDYRAFEAAVIVDYDARTAVERELVLRLASLLWRLRRATSIETALLGIQAGIVCESRHHKRSYMVDRGSCHQPRRSIP
jgi:hypothetical protein